MMILFYTILSLFSSIAPFYYFLRIFKHMKKVRVIILYTLTIVSILTLLIKIFLKPSFDLWFYTVSFYILSCFLFCLCLLIYRLWYHYFHHTFSKINDSYLYIDFII